MRLTGRPLLWLTILFPLCTFLASYPVAFTQPYKGGPPPPDEPYCSRPLKFRINYLSNSIDYEPSSSIGSFGTGLTAMVAVLFGLAQYEYVKSVIKCNELKCVGLHSTADSVATNGAKKSTRSNDSSAPASNDAALTHRASSTPPLTTTEGILHILEKHGSTATQPQSALNWRLRGVGKPANVLRLLARLNELALILGGISIVGAIGVAAVNSHIYGPLHYLAAGLFFGGTLGYEIIHSFIVRHIGSLNHRRVAVIEYVQMCFIFIGVVSIILTVIFGNLLPDNFKDLPLDQIEAKDQRIVETAAGLEITTFIFMLAYIATWDSHFKVMAVNLSLSPTKLAAPIAPQPADPSAQIPQRPICIDAGVDVVPTPPQSHHAVDVSSIRFHDEEFVDPELAIPDTKGETNPPRTHYRIAAEDTNDQEQTVGASA